jgi:F0F1-type ATP synthase membrane subunit a
LNVLALIFSIILVVIFWRSNGLPVLREKQNLWIVATASCVVPVTNILVAIALCHYLRKIKQAQAEFVKCVSHTPFNYVLRYNFALLIAIQNLHDGGYTYRLDRW